MVKNKNFIMSSMFFGLITTSWIITSTTENILSLLSQEKYFLYQDILINNSILTRGVGPDCPSRYEAIKPILNRYKKPIKILDLGASNGYFSLRIAHDYDALCIMIDGSNRLKNICEFNNEIDGIIYLQKYVSLEDLLFLNQKEHFDVILAFNIIHHLNPYKEILDILFELGDIVIIETPPANDMRIQDKPTIPLIEQYLLEKAPSICLNLTLRSPAKAFDHITKLNPNQDLLAQKTYSQNTYAKMLCFQKESIHTRELPSLKLETYQALNGVYNKSKYFNPTA